MAVEELGIKFVSEGFESLERNVKTLEKESDDASKAIEKLAKSTSELDNQLEGLEQQSKLTRDANGRLRDEFGRFVKDADRATDSTDKFGRKAKDAGRGAFDLSNIIANSLSVALGNILSKAAEIATEALINLGMAAFDALKDSVGLAIDFESAMTELSIAAKSSGLSFDELKQASIAVGGASDLVGVSASGAAEAMTNLFKAGLTSTEVFGDFNKTLEDGNQLSGALRASIDLAAATELDMAAASELAAVALATFGGELETEEERAQFIRAAMDNFVKSADASVASVSGLADALKNVGPVASSMGLSLEDTNNALAILSTRGIEGAEAGTSLKSMLNNMIRPTDSVKDAFSDLNVSLYDAEGVFKPMPQILQEMAQALYGTSTATVVVGGRTEEQNALLEEAQKRYEQLTRRINNHNLGLNVMSDSALKKANEELAASQSIISELSGITGTATTVTRELTDAQRDEYIQTIAGTYGKNALITLLEEVNTLNEEGVNGWDAMAQATENASGIQEQATAKAATFAGRMEALQGVIETLQIQIGDAFLPILGELVGSFIEIAEGKGPKLVSFIQSIASYIKPLIGVIVNLSSQIITFGQSAQQFIIGVIEKTRPNLERLASIFVELGAKVSEFIQNALVKFGVWFEENRPLIEDFAVVLVGWFGDIADVISTMWDIISPILSGFIDIILDLVTLVMQIATGDWSGAWETIGDIVLDTLLSIGTGIAKFVEGFIDLWRKGFDMGVKVIYDFVESVLKIFYDLVAKLIGNSIIPDMLEAILKAFTNFGESWTNLIRSIVSAIQVVFTELSEWLQRQLENLLNFWIEIWSEAERFIISVWDTISSIVSEAIDTIFDIVVSTLESLLESWTNIWQSISDKLVGEDGIFTKLVEEVKAKAQAIFQAVTEKILAIGTWITENTQKLIGYGADIVAGIEQGVKDNVSKIVSAITGAIEALNLKAGEIWETIKGFGADILDGIQQGVEDNWSKLQDGIKTAIDNVASSVMNATGVLFSAISSLGSAIGQALIEAITGAADIGTAIANLVIDAFNDAIDAINQVFADLGIPVELDKIPHLQMGTLDFQQGGFALVGESGPEVVGLPGGSSVLPASGGATDRLMNMIESALNNTISDIQPVTNITNYYYNDNRQMNNNLTTQSLVRPGGLAMEFDTMSMVSR